MASAQRRLGHHRAADRRRRALRAVARRRPASSRSRTRATCWSPCSLPDGASLRAHAEGDGPGRRRSRKQTPGVDQVVTIAGISPLDNSASLANAGVAYMTLKPWSERGKGQDLLSLFIGMNKAMRAGDGRARAGRAAAADPGRRQRVGLHHAARTARRQLRLHQAADARQRDGRRPAARPDRASSA